MNNENALRGMLLSLFVLISVGSLGHACADSLTAESTKNTYYLFEPVVVKVTLQLDEPFQDVRHDPIQADRQYRRLTRHLNAELRDADRRKLCEAVLGGGGFYPNENAGAQFHATLIGVLGELTPGQRESIFRFWDTPGAYSLTVVDEECRLKSNDIPITIVVPEEHAMPASELFQSGGLGLFLALQVNEHGWEVRPLLDRLVKEHRDTIYGKYAKMCLVLLQAESIRSRRITAQPEIQHTLGADLEETTTLFEPGHPLRSRALWYLARIQRAPGVEGNSEETITQLLSETDDGYTIRLAKESLDELTRIRQDKASKAGN